MVSEEPQEAMELTTLGMLIIDDIYWPIPYRPNLDVLGGAGTWAACGARILRPGAASSKITHVIHKGHDFPRSVEDEIRAWKTNALFHDTPWRLTTRAVEMYDRAGTRSESYPADGFRVDENWLSSDALRAKTFHMVCRPQRAMDLVEGISLRRGALKCNEEPLIVWEPIPFTCVAAEYDDIVKAAKAVDVISPNEEELASMFGAKFDATVSEEQLRSEMEERCERLKMQSQADVVIRRGARGSYVHSPGRRKYLPAYFGAEESERVVDSTGGGNTFLGGFCIGLLERPLPGRTQLETAAVYGTISASFAIEQHGPPKLSYGSNGAELWNMENVGDRWTKYLARSKMYM